MAAALLFLWRGRTRKQLGRTTREVMADLRMAVAHLTEPTPSSGSALALWARTPHTVSEFSPTLPLHSTL